MAVPTLKDLLDEGVSGRGVLVRSDFNVPLDGTKITDPGRIIASLPTLNALIDAGAKVIRASGPVDNLPGAFVRPAILDVTGVDVPDEE